MKRMSLFMARVKQENCQRLIVARFVRQTTNMTKDLITDLPASEINEKVFQELATYNVDKIADQLTGLSPAHLYNEVKNGRGDNLYYMWLACLVRLLKPRQVVELGAAGGISTIMIASELTKDAKFCSVDNDPQIAWKWIVKDYPQLTKILGDDLDMDIWKDIDLNKTDLFFIDTLHLATQLNKEIELYSPYWKKGAIVVFDDIKMPELRPIWEALPYDKCEDDRLHYSGFGFCRK